MTKEENALLIAQKEYDKTLKNSPTWEEIEQESDEIHKEEIDCIMGRSFILLVLGTYLAVFLATEIWVLPGAPWGLSLVFALGPTTLLMFAYSAILDPLYNHLKNKND